MTEMIERVARAICVADGVDPDFPLPQQQGEKLTPQWMDYLGLARVAIEAMREPTDEMTRAGHATWKTRPYSYEAIFNAMIGAALK